MKFLFQNAGITNIEFLNAYEVKKGKKV